MANNKIKPIRSQKEILSFFKKNEGWISAFTCADGSFTASFYPNIHALWGFRHQCEYNLTQSMADLELLRAINKIFDDKGSIHERAQKVGQLSFRKKEVLNNTIIPYFIKYPPIGLKSQAFLVWVEII